MKNGSFFFSFFAQQELIWFEHLNAEKRMLLPGAFDQTIIACGEPVRLRLLGKRQMERIERSESERRELARAFGRLRARGYPQWRSFEQQSCRQAPVFSRILFVSKMLCSC